MTQEIKDIKERIFVFAVRVIKLCHRKPGVSRTLSGQLLRAGTSVGANVEEAQAGQSRADFISKYSIALKEARETHYWLRLLLESGDCPSETAAPRCQEADEIKRILAAIIVKTKRNSTSQ